MAENSKERPISEVFYLIAELGLKHGAESINMLPGCWTLDINKVFIAVNGHAEAKVASVPGGGEINVEPYGAVMFQDGWPVYIGDSFGGTVSGIAEDELIEKLKALLV